MVILDTTAESGWFWTVQAIRDISWSRPDDGENISSNGDHLDISGSLEDVHHGVWPSACTARTKRRYLLYNEH